MIWRVCWHAPVVGNEQVVRLQQLALGLVGDELRAQLRERDHLRHNIMMIV